MGLLRGLTFAALAVSTMAVAPAAASEPEPSELTLEALFGDAADERSSVPDVGWRPGHETLVWVDGHAEGGPALIELDVVSGQRRTVLDTPRLVELWGDREAAPPSLGDPVFGPDGTVLLLGGGEDPALIDLATGTLTNLTAGEGDEEHPCFSPDGRRIAWVRNNDLFVYALDAGRELRLTTDGSDTVLNGVFDWVYKEELASRDGRAFAWSADGSALTWLRLDDGEIPAFHLVDLMDTHSTLIEQYYPKAGDPSPTPSLVVVEFDELSRPSAPVRIGFDLPLPYVPRFGFTPAGALWYQELDRAQERLVLTRVDPETGVSSVLLDERDPYWIEPVDGLRFLADGSFLWLSRGSGFMHLERVFPDGSTVDLSPGDWDVTELVGVDSGGRFGWIQAARPSALERRLYRVDLSTGETIELTPSAGTHAGVLSPAGDKILVTSSSVDRPAHRLVVDGQGVMLVGVDVEVDVDAAPPVPVPDVRFVEIAADDGLALNAVLLLPPGFDETRRYPVVIYTYGGPHAQVVRNTWPRSSGRFNYFLAARGFIVFALDNRGSAGRGREFEGGADLGLGSKQLPDQLAGVRWLTDQPWVDAGRIGIWGWSYGGYMTSFALTHSPGTFAAGVAVAPVTDWRLYDSIYTERYMGTPEENPGGYAAGSVLDAAGNLEDPLLVIHGTGDDNVHVQNTFQLADRAWRSGVRFDLMLFPSLKHGIDAPGSHLRVFSAVADFFEKHLVSAERSGDRELVAGEDSAEPTGDR